MRNSSYGQEVESPDEFLEQRARDIVSMAGDTKLKDQAIALQVAANSYRFGYQQLWCGVPVIRLPDDILLLQEIVFSLKPRCIVETGVARGGSLLLNASLMDISGLQPHVLGIDICIYQHAHEAVQNSKYSSSIELIQSDSTSITAQAAVRRLLQKVGKDHPSMLILDSNHTQAHVSKELDVLASDFPIGSVVIVADTLIEHMPAEIYVNRPWGVGNNPLTAARDFLARNNDFKLHEQWSYRGLISELHGGVLVRTK
jgi:cephalosporin hydroxylase